MSHMSKIACVVLMFAISPVAMASEAYLLAPLVKVGAPSAMPQEPVNQNAGDQAGGGYVLPYRNDQAAAQAATADVARALLEATRKNGEMLNEILRIQRDAGKSPAVVAPPVVDVPRDGKPSIKDRIHDKIEGQKDAVADFVDSLVGSPFARRALILAVILGAIWFSIKKHKKDGTPTHIERATEAIKNATSGIPIVGQVTSIVDKISDSAGDKIRELQDKLAAKHAEAEAKKAELEAQKELTKVALATPAPSQVVAQTPVRSGVA
jgi:hypothetical protein